MQQDRYLAEQPFHVLEDYDFAFPFSLPLKDTLSTMQYEGTDQKKPTDGTAGHLTEDNHDATYEDHCRQSEQASKNPHRHSSGDTAPSSTESIGNLFSPWGAFSPADSTQLSTHSTAFGASSFSGSGLNWSQSPPTMLSRTTAEQIAIDERAPMLCTGGTQGPLDTYSVSRAQTRKDYKDVDNLFDGLNMEFGTKTSDAKPSSDNLRSQYSITSVIPDADPEARSSRDRVSESPAKEKAGYFESLYSSEASDDHLQQPKSQMQKPKIPLFGLESSTLWNTPPRSSEEHSISLQRQRFQRPNDQLLSGSLLDQSALWTTPDQHRFYQYDEVPEQTHVPSDAISHPLDSAYSSGTSLVHAHYPVTSGPLSPEYSIFVGDLCPDLREEDLVAQFLRPPHWPSSHPFAIAHAHAQHAQGNYSTPARVAPAPFTSTKSATIMTDPLTGASRGFGFVRFSSEQDCSRALLEMQGVIMSPKTGQVGRPLRVCPATPKNRTPNASSLATTSALTAIGERVYGASALSQNLGTSSALSLLKADTATGSASPYASGSSGQASAVPPLQAGDSSARQYSASALDPSNTTVFVGGLSSLISEETLKTFFVPFGEIKYVKVPPGKGCGFVQFVRKMDAERAIERMQGFPIGGGRIRLSWGRSQGDKAAAAAAHAAAQAAQIGHLAGLAGLNPITTSQLTAVTLANSANVGSTHDANSLLVRRLTAAAAAASAGREGMKAHEGFRGGLSDLSSAFLTGADPTEVEDSRVHFSGTIAPSKVYGKASLPSAFAEGSSMHASWPGIDTAAGTSHSQIDRQLSSMLSSMHMDRTMDNEVASGTAVQDATSALRERSHTYTLGAAADLHTRDAIFAPFSSGNPASTSTLGAAHTDGNLLAYARQVGAPHRGTLDSATHMHTSLFQPFSPLPSRALTSNPGTIASEIESAGAINGEHNTQKSSEVSFKRYLEQQRERERQQKQNKADLGEADPTSAATGRQSMSDLLTDLDARSLEQKGE